MKRDDMWLKLEEMQVEEGCPLDGKSLIESNIRKHSGGALVMSIRSEDGERIVSLPPDYRIRLGDTLILLCTDESLEKALELGKPN